MEKGISWKPGPAVKQLELIRERNKLQEFFTRRLSGNWISKGILAMDQEGNRHLIEDDGQSLSTDGIKIECKENPLPALAKILSERQLILLDWQLLSRSIMLSSVEALQYMKESGMQIASVDGTVYRYQNGLIFKGKNTVDKIPEGDYLPEKALLMFSSLDTQPVLPDGELGRAMRDTKGALPG